MIEIKNLYKRYHNHHGSDWVLKDINLTIPTGVSVGLIGRNGAGKSTLLRLIAGMDTPDRGEVIRHSRVSWPVGLAGGMQNNMTGRQNTKFVARAQGCGPEEVKRVIEFVQDFAEIGKAFDEPVRTYSSGMRSRLSFGLSLSFDFDVYISDEATAVGDLVFKDKAINFFKEKVENSSLIMVSHSEGMLRKLCKSGLYIKSGNAVWYDNINHAIQAYHRDCDKLPKLEINPDKEILDKLNRVKSVVAALNHVKSTLNEGDFNKDEEKKINGIKNLYSKKALALNESYLSTPSGIESIERNKTIKNKKSIDSLNIALKENDCQLGEKELTLLDKCKKILSKS